MGLGRGETKFAGGACGTPLLCLPPAGHRAPPLPEARRALLPPARPRLLTPNGGPAARQPRRRRGRAELRGAQPAQRSQARPRRPPPAAKTPRFLYRAKGGCRSAKMGRQTAAGGRSMQRSQSRSSLSASFEALAVYFPCMNSLEEEDRGEGSSGARGAGGLRTVTVPADGEGKRSAGVPSITLGMKLLTRRWLHRKGEEGLCLLRFLRGEKKRRYPHGQISGTVWARSGVPCQSTLAV